MRSYRWAEVVSHLVGHRDVGNCRRNVFAVVQEGDDARVEALQAAAVMLERKSSKELIFATKCVWIAEQCFKG